MNWTKETFAFPVHDLELRECTFWFLYDTDCFHDKSGYRLQFLFGIDHFHYQSTFLFLYGIDHFHDQSLHFFNSFLALMIFITRFYVCIPFWHWWFSWPESTFVLLYGFDHFQDQNVHLYSFFGIDHFHDQSVHLYSFFGIDHFHDQSLRLYSFMASIIFHEMVSILICK